MLKTKNLLINTVVSIIFISIIFFFFTYWLYSYNNIATPFKEAWSLTISMLSALATIGAAVIAASLFNDWKEQQRHQNLLHFGLEVYTNFKPFDDLFKKTVEELLVYNLLLNKACEEKDQDEINKIIEDSNLISQNEKELEYYFSNFHDSFINYCIITKQEDKINTELKNIASVFHEFNEKLMFIAYINDINERHDVIKFLIGNNHRRISTQIYTYIIKQILFEIRQI
ncbi:hypothetical protein [Acinetobacter pittii]|uniref:hypothetical protein n=1 Tax=Acinetobacter pittii TaxID=48296 RepID=UPI0038914103